MPPPSETECPHCGCCFTPEKHTRSVPQHNRLILLCRLVFEHWPESLHDVFIPKSEDHMRYFLVSRIEGYFDVKRTIRVQTENPMIAYNAMKILLDESDAENTFIELEGNQITRRVAHSIAFGQLDQYSATKLFTQIDEVISAYGFNAERLLAEARRTA